MNIKATEPRPAPTLVEITASMPTWAKFLNAGEGEFVRPTIGVPTEFSPERTKMTLSKLKLVTMEGDEPEEVGRIVVSEGQIEELVGWIPHAFWQLTNPEANFDESDRAPFFAVMGEAEKIDAVFTAETLDYLVKGTVTPGKIRLDGSTTLVEVIRTTGNETDGDVKTETAVISGDRLHKVRALKESIERGSGGTWDSLSLERNLRAVERKVDLDHQIRGSVFLGE